MAAQTTSSFTRSLWAARVLVQPSAPPRRRHREAPDEPGLALKLYYLAEQIDDQRQLAWYETRHWTRRGIQLTAISAAGSALGAGGLALGNELVDWLRYTIVVVALVAAGLGAAAAAIGAPEKAATQQQRFVALDALSRYADHVELIELPRDTDSAEDAIRTIDSRLDEINNAQPTERPTSRQIPPLQGLT